MISILIFVGKCLYYDAIYYFSVWLRTSSYPPDINRFRSHDGKVFPIANRVKEKYKSEAFYN